MSESIAAYLRHACRVLGASPTAEQAAEQLGTPEKDFGVGSQLVFRPNCEALRGGYVARKFQSDEISHVFLEHDSDVALLEIAAELGRWKEHPSLSVSAPRQALFVVRQPDTPGDCAVIADIRGDDGQEVAYAFAVRRGRRT